MIGYGDQAMEQLHTLMERQIQSHFGGRRSIPGEWQRFVDAVNAAYFEFDAERDQLQRSLDLTSQALLEASSEVRAIFERLIDSSIEGILAFDRECRFTVWNPALERIFGLNKLQVLGKRALDAFPFLRESGSERFYRDALDGKNAVATDRAYIVPGTGEQIVMEGRFSPLLDDWGEIIGGLAIFRDITERKRAEALQAEKSRQTALRADISVAFASKDDLSAILHTCAEALVQHLDAAFARIWTVNEDRDMLELRASAGLYTHLEGPHSRIPVGKLKVGLIAQERSPHLTNDVLHDPLISDRAWAEREGMLAFAGHPLVAGDRLVGVMALFARKALLPDTLDALASVAGLITQGIERKRTEDALRQRERELHQLIQVIPQCMCVDETDGNVLYANESLLNYFGLTLQDVQASDFRARTFHPEDLDRVRSTFEKAICRGLSWEVETRLLRKDGQYRWFLIRSNPLRDEQGRIVRWYSSGTDIEELKRAESALRERERELQQLVDLVPHNILVLGADGSPLYANQGLREYFGFTLKEIQADDFRARVYHPEDLERIKRERDDAMSRGIVWESEARLRRKDGRYRWLLIRSNPHRDEQGRMVRWYSTGTDIEDRKQAEDALRRAQGELQRERDRLKLLLELTNQVVSNLELREMLRALAASVRRVMLCDVVSVRLPDSEKKQLRVYALDFPDSKGFLKEETVVPIEGSLSGGVFQTGKPYVSDDLATDAAASPGLAEGLKAGCFLPLIHRDRVLGVMGLGRREETFTPEEVGFLAQVAGQVAIAVENAVAYRQITDLKDQLAQEKLYLEDEIRSEHRFEDIIGRSQALHAVLRQVETVAGTDCTVLIYGETGTGKELVARAIHDLSPRSTQAFVKLNCAAIPTGLLESELFGHEKGAFTGAIAQRIGRFELAHHGTVFLDEIGDIPLELQPKLFASAARARVRAPGKFAHASHRCPLDCRDKPRSFRHGGRAEVPHRPFLSLKRLSHPFASPPGAPGRYSPVGPTFRSALQPAHEKAHRYYPP